MGNYRISWARDLPFVVVWVMAAFVLAGCQTLSTSRVGQHVPAEKRVALAPEGTHSASYQTEDLTIDFTYSRSQSAMEISGAVRFAGRLRWSFVRVEGFHADIMFTNGDGVVLDWQGLVSSSSDTTDSLVSFRRTVTLPGGVEAVTFAYTGTAVGMGAGSGGQMGFWDNPSR